MTEMGIVNVRFTKQLAEKLENASKTEYLSVGEAVRSAIIDLLIRFKAMPQGMLLDSLREEMQAAMKKRGEVFNPEKEIMGLRKLRASMWRKSHESGSRHK